MSALDSGKAFEDLTDAELDELAARDWSAAEIILAIGAALEARDMPAVASLMHRLALKDPQSAVARAYLDGAA
jgi:hypothetical protein